MSDLTAAAIEAALHDLPLGHPLHFFPVVGSTNDEAKRLAESGAAEGTLVVAEAQTAGRGRAGRPWQTPPGVALAASMVLRPNLPPAQLGRMTMLGGLAAAEAIETATGLAAALKWPNDVWVNAKKVAGVLAEASVAGEQAAYVVLGVGINVNGGPPAGAALDHPATCLAAETGAPVDRLDLLAALVQRLGEWYQDAGAESLREAWAARLLWRGERVAAGDLSGVVEGVDAGGALILRLDSGERRRVAAGDARLARRESALA